MIRRLVKFLRRLVIKILRIPQVIPQDTHLARFDLKHMHRVLSCSSFYESISTLNGCVVEAGVGQGRGLAIWTALSLREGKNRKIWAFDSFEGFPSLVAEDEASDNFIRGLAEYKKFDIPYVRSTLNEFGISYVDIDRMISVVKGFIPASCEMYNGGAIALLYLDLDIYEGYRDALTYFFDKVAPGGVVVFDEYLKPLDAHKWPGASKAINEFLESKNLLQSVRVCDLTGNRYLIKAH